VQVGDRLPLDQHASGDPVVALRQRLDGDPRAQTQERSGDGASLLEHVGDDEGDRLPLLLLHDCIL